MTEKGFGRRDFLKRAGLAGLAGVSWLTPVGHLTAVNGTPLPARQRALWCGGTGDQGPGPDRRPAHRPGWYTVTEHLTDY